MAISTLHKTATTIATTTATAVMAAEVQTGETATRTANPAAAVIHTETTTVTTDPLLFTGMVDYKGGTAIIEEGTVPNTMINPQSQREAPAILKSLERHFLRPQHLSVSSNMASGFRSYPHLHYQHPTPHHTLWWPMQCQASTEKCPICR